MVEQLVHEPEQDFTVLAVDLDGKAYVLVGDQCDDALEPEYSSAMRHDPRTAVVVNVPSQRISLEHRFSGLELLVARRGRDQYLRCPHLDVRSLAEQCAAAGELPVCELQRQPLAHVVRADRKASRRGCGTAEFLALVDHSQRADAAHTSGGPCMRKC